MHGKFLLELADLFLVTLEQQVLILRLVHCGSVLHLLHPGGKPQRRDSLFDVFGLRPHIRDKNGLAVTSDRVLQQVGQLALPVRHMVTFRITSRHYNLLKER